MDVHIFIAFYLNTEFPVLHFEKDSFRQQRAITRFHPPLWSMNDNNTFGGELPQFLQLLINTQDYQHKVSYGNGLYNNVNNPANHRDGLSLLHCPVIKSYCFRNRKVKQFFAHRKYLPTKQPNNMVVNFS